RQQSQDEQTLAKPKEQLPPLPPIMETQAVQNSPIMENLNMNAPQEDFTKSPFLNPNPNPAEVSGQNQAVNQPQKQKKKGKFLPVFLLLGIIIFFVIYTVVWAKLFNLF
ncbi:MAG TPA: hypothetical protein VES68_03760, partial [Candidatus Sulfotelmatobacter sp.]|nr:hypothetical protein [Candidatus Sulfotelmatobacter sp.]